MPQGKGTVFPNGGAGGSHVAAAASRGSALNMTGGLYGLRIDGLSPLLLVSLSLVSLDSDFDISSGIPSKRGYIGTELASIHLA